jgi:NADH dehydrogenase
VSETILESPSRQLETKDTSGSHPRDYGHRVVVVGGGFGGLHVARALRKSPVRVTLVDRRNFHLFQPLLYQVATGGLSPANIAAPLRAVLRRQANAEVLLAEVTGFDAAQRKVILADGELPYDSLVVAAGAGHSYFGNDSWSELAPGLKSIEEATDIRRRILLAFEAAEREEDPKRREELLTFLIVGGGPTGVELAGALSEIARHTLRRDFRHIEPSLAKILLVDVADRILGAYPETLSSKALRYLTGLGVTVRTGTRVIDIRSDHVTIEHEGRTESVPTRTVLWAAGVQASPLAKSLAAATGSETDRSGRLKVRPDLTVGDYRNVFVIGDMAHCPGPDGKPLPGVAPVAIQQGKDVARRIVSRLRRRPEPGSFRYRDPGSMATIGRAAAVAELGRFRFSGFFAWLLWLFVHIMQLTQFENRLLVLMQWGWSYVTFNRTARLITGTPCESILRPPREDG